MWLGDTGCDAMRGRLFAVRDERPKDTLDPKAAALGLLVIGGACDEHGLRDERGATRAGRRCGCGIEANDNIVLAPCVGADGMVVHGDHRRQAERALARDRRRRARAAVGARVATAGPRATGGPLVVEDVRGDTADNVARGRLEAEQCCELCLLSAERRRPSGHILGSCPVALSTLVRSSASICVVVCLGTVTVVGGHGV